MWALTTIAATLLVYAALSPTLTRLDISPAMFFMTAGIIVGPILGLLDLSLGSHEVKLLAEVTLTLVLFCDATHLTRATLEHRLAVPVRLLAIGLPLTIVAGALAGAGLLPGIGLGEALVLSVMLACTDAALGQAVVSDERIPLQIRQGLNIESGLNDGLCVPLFFIAIAIAEAQEGIISSHLALHLVAEQIGYGLVAGVIAGAVAAIGLTRSGGESALGRHWTQVLTASAALLAAGIATGLGGSIFIAAFTGGATFSLLRRDEGQEEVTDLLDDAGAMLNGVTFVVFGSIVLGALADEITWQIVAYAIVSLTVVRMLPVAVSMLGTGARPPTLAFLGWFGPRGLASIVFGVILLDDAELPHSRTLLVATATTIAISVYAHGLTAPPLTKRFVAWCLAHPRTPLTEPD